MIQDAIRQAQQLHRKNTEATYDGECSIYEYKGVKDDKTKLTNKGPVKIHEGLPCHISYSKIPVAEGSTATVRQQSIKLFLPPEIEVKAGSKIIVTQNGRTQEYAGSGEPAVYASHQEINLELFRGWT